MNTQFDVAIVGSGPAGVAAAYPLVKTGYKVAIVDAGPLHDPATKLLPIQSKFEIIQGLGKGGLSQLWSGVCDYYSKEELMAIGLPPAEIQKEYKKIVNNLASKLTTTLDHHDQLILKSAKKNHLEAQVYQALTFLYNSSESVDDLKKYKNFTYIDNQLVQTVRDQKTHVDIHSLSINTSQPKTTRVSFVILAAGSLNTTRILLRTFNLFNYRSPFLTKVNYITACLHTKTLFNRNDDYKQRLGHLVISTDKKYTKLDSFFVHLYPYNPEKIEHALAYIPLPKSIARLLLATVGSSLVIADIRFPASLSKNKFCVLKKTKSGDLLEIVCKESKDEQKHQESEFRGIKNQLQTLGLLPLKTIKGYTTSHYAGGLSFQTKPGKLSVDANGKLNQARRIYIADASTWQALPAKPPTLTIMANAARVAKKVVSNLNALK